MAIGYYAGDYDAPSRAEDEYRVVEWHDRIVIERRAEGRENAWYELKEYDTKVFQTEYKHTKGMLWWKKEVVETEEYDHRALKEFKTVEEAAERIKQLTPKIHNV